MRAFFIAAALLAAVSPALAEVKVETVVDGLKNPCGVAIQPETGHVFVSDSGALRTVRVVDGKIEEVVTAFSKDTYEADPKLEIGPLGLTFLDKETLVVGGGGKRAGEDELLIYKLPSAGEKPQLADAAKFRFQIAAGENVVGEGNFFGVAATKSAIFVVSEGESAKGWICKADVNGTKVENFRRFIATKEATGIGTPSAVTISPRGDVIVGQRGQSSTPKDSQLSFFSARDGALLASYAIGLDDIRALAYSPKGQLYALDGMWSEPDSGGLYQLIAVRGVGEPRVRAKKIAELDRPSAMAFGIDGTLYITLIGDSAGKLVRIASGL